MSVFNGSVVVINASAAQAASFNTTFDLKGATAATFLLNVTASSGPTTLDIYLQTSPNGGTTWYDYAHFTQVGAVATSIQALSWSRKENDGTGGVNVITTGDAALAAAKVINGPVVDSQLRAKAVIAGTSYTYSLVAICDRDS